MANLNESVSFTIVSTQIFGLSLSFGLNHIINFKSFTVAKNIQRCGLPCIITDSEIGINYFSQENSKEIDVKIIDAYYKVYWFKVICL